MALFPFALGAQLPAECRGGVVTIGNFDGVHRGHQALLAEAVRRARERGAPALAFTFDPHPLELLRPEAFQPVLTTLDRRADLIQAAGVDHLIVLETTSAFLRLGARDFFQTIVVDVLQARGLVEGWNFCFGRGREGNMDTLRTLGEAAGVDVALLPPQKIDGRVVSSSVVREGLLAGDVADAALLLGRPYRLQGRVEPAQQRGRTIGFPTANLHQVRTLIPDDGVYAVLVPHHGRVWPGAANIGPNPTFGEQGHKVEVHLIGFQGNLYGQTLDVDFLQRIRATQAFASVQDLTAQIRRDVQEAERICRQAGAPSSGQQ